MARPRAELAGHLARCTTLFQVSVLAKADSTASADLEIVLRKTWERGPVRAMLSISSHVPRVPVIWTVVLLLAWTAATTVWAAPPARWVSRGPGGGGSFFAPEINPYNPDELWIGSDMGDLFHSTRFRPHVGHGGFPRACGGGSQPGRMEFTSDPLVRYALNGSVPARSA